LRIVSLIEAGEGAAAEAAWRSHLEGIQRHVAGPQEPVPLDLAD
jgi:DNA-binding FadR family transcriptional regulator